MGRRRGDKLLNTSHSKAVVKGESVQWHASTVSTNLFRGKDRRASLGRRAASSLPAPRRDALLSAALRCSAAEEEEQNRVGDRFYNAPQKSIIDLGSAYIRFYPQGGWRCRRHGAHRVLFEIRLKNCRQHSVELFSDALQDTNTSSSFPTHLEILCVNGFLRWDTVSHPPATHSYNPQTTAHIKGRH